MDGEAGGSKRTPEFWTLFMGGVWWWEYSRTVDKTGHQVEGLREGSREEDVRGWTTHEQGGLFSRRSQIWAQA